MKRSQLVIGLVSVTAAAALTSWSLRGTMPVDPVEVIDDPFHSTHEAGRVLVKAEPLTKVRIPVTNRLGVAVRFGPPDCGCQCRAASWSDPALGPGEQRDLIVAVDSVSGKPGTFSCTWTDDTGRPWSADCRVTYIPEEWFADSPARRLGLRPNATFTEEVRFVQHALPGTDLPPIPSFAVADKRVRLVPGQPTTEVIEEGWTRRIIPVRVEVAVGEEPGVYAAHICANRPVPPVSVEWQVQAVVEVSPVNLVLTRKDFEGGKVVRRSFLVRGRDAIVRVTGTSTTGVRDGLIRIAVTNGEAGATVVEVESRRPDETTIGEIVLQTDIADCPRVRIPVAYIAE